ncbi:S1 RNA-binding domain-containing protein [Streptomyces sp. NPDC007983]|uniref:S1 RNA-binding domain-containing protein n=1 Tax=Streptomyces sp. NPDC007983 TaxID=3364800 RepID=UPI0036E3497D
MPNSEHCSPRAFLEALEIGQVCRGVVKSVADFGVFVDLGGAVGIVTPANLSWKRIDHPSQVTRTGQEVLVTVLSVDVEREQASVSLKELHRDPFLDFTRSRFDSTITGTVTKVAPVGAFMQLEDDIIGFLPVSEYTHCGRSVNVGDTPTVKVTYVNVTRRQVVLSLIRADQDS